MVTPDLEPILQSLFEVHSRPLRLGLLQPWSVLRDLGNTQDLTLVLASLTDVLLSCQVVSERSEVLEVAVTNQAEEYLLLGRPLVLAAEIFWDEFLSLLEVVHVL